MSDSFRTTKILITVGPSTHDHDTVCELINQGVDGFRFNFSHGEIDQHLEILSMIRECARNQNRTVACLADLQGPKIRLGKLSDDPLYLAEGSDVILAYEEELPDYSGSNPVLPIDYKHITDDLKTGDTVFLNDGQIKLTVETEKKNHLEAHVNIGGNIWSRKGVNIPTTELTVPALTEKDREQLEMIVEEDFDLVALSFVRRAEDVEPARGIINNTGEAIDLVAKIESRIALDNLDGIIDQVEGIMVARGDLGAEIGSERVPFQQKMMIEKANSRGKFVVTATQMLESMIEHPTPTRAEVSDVANAILDGSDVLMLSGETAVGEFPVEAATTMKQIIRDTEDDFYDTMTAEGTEMDCDERKMAVAMSNAAAKVAREVEASAIVAPTASGSTARFMSNTYPGCPVLVPSFNKKTRQKTAIYRNVTPIKLKKITNTDRLMDEAVRLAQESEVADTGDQIVLITGLPITEPGVTNFLHVLDVE
ncbi:MAG: pyruvate kinase [bacterium]